MGMYHSSFRVWVRFTKAENVAVSVLDIKIAAGPRSFCKRLEHLSPTYFQFAEQATDTAYGNVRIQMFVLFPVHNEDAGLPASK
jgi:hypothetical protein